MKKMVGRGIKPYEELDFTDDFMFGKVMEDLTLCQDVLECLLQRKIGKLEESALQKEFKFTDEGKPIRMDVFSHTEGELFDTEMQNLNRKSISSLELPKRTRFYQASMDADYVKKGHSYKMLPDSTILFVCTFDPFRKNLGRYTFHERCVEDGSLYLGDGTTKVFCNCTYKGNDLPKNLKELYEYVNTGKVTGLLSNRIHEAVRRARTVEKWRSDYMKEMVLLMDAREEGREEGREEERRKTEAERRKTEAERRKTEAERRRADAAEARVRELEARLAAAMGSDPA